MALISNISVTLMVRDHHPCLLHKKYVTLRWILLAGNVSEYPPGVEGDVWQVDMNMKCSLQVGCFPNLQENLCSFQEVVGLFLSLFLSLFQFLLLYPSLFLLTLLFLFLFLFSHFFLCLFPFLFSFYFRYFVNFHSHYHSYSLSCIISCLIAILIPALFSFLFLLSLLPIRMFIFWIFF